MNLRDVARPLREERRFTNPRAKRPREGQLPPSNPHLLDDLEQALKRRERGVLGR